MNILRAIALSLILLVGLVGQAPVGQAPDPKSKPPEVSTAELQAKISWLERKLAVTEAKTYACLSIYNADQELSELNRTSKVKQ